MLALSFFNKAIVGNSSPDWAVVIATYSRVIDACFVNISLLHPEPVVRAPITVMISPLSPHPKKIASGKSGQYSLRNIKRDFYTVTESSVLARCCQTHMSGD